MHASTSQTIAAAEQRVKAAFTVSNARVRAALPASPPTESSRLGDLITHAGAIERARSEVADIAGDLAAGVKAANDSINDAIVHGSHLGMVADFIEGKALSVDTVSPELQTLARSARAAVLAGLADGAQVAADIRRGIDGAMSELKRFKGKFVEQSALAARIAGARYTEDYAKCFGCPAEVKRAALRVERLKALHRVKFVSNRTTDWRA
jgi:hypothetical protein